MCLHISLVLAEELKKKLGCNPPSLFFSRQISTIIDLNKVKILPIAILSAKQVLSGIA